jgi:hypothetical protein
MVPIRRNGPIYLRISSLIFDCVDLLSGPALGTKGTPWFIGDNLVLTCTPWFHLVPLGSTWFHLVQQGDDVLERHAGNITVILPAPSLPYARLL